MNGRNLIRRIIPEPKEPLSISPPATIILVAALFLLAGFILTKFLVNFDRLERLAEQNRGETAAVTAGPSTKDTGLTGDAQAPASVDPAEVAAWLAPLNHYRAMVGLLPVTADARLSRGDFLHSRYLAINYASLGRDLRLDAEAHTENPAKEGFTDAGAAAAQASDVDWMWNPQSRPEPSWAIGNWMEVPFHRMQIINPYLRRVGYGSDCRDAVCFAALNTGTDVEHPPGTPVRWPKPLSFPPDGATVDINEFSGEWPDPLTSCSGYKSPAGLPITAEFGHLVAPEVSDYSITTDADEPIEACAFDANSYVNPDPAAQTAARAILTDFGAIVIVPRRPLSAGRYVVTLTAGQKYSWSFSVVPRNHG
jgi:hypothetical protein